MRCAIFVVIPLFLLAALGLAEDELVRPLGPAVVRAGTVALLLSGQSGGALRLEVLVAPAPVPVSTATVVVKVDGSSFLEGHEGPALRADVFVYAIGSEGETLAQAAQRFLIDVEGYRERLADSGMPDSGVELAVDLDLPAGEHEVRVLARSETGAFGLVVVPAGGSEVRTEDDTSRSWAAVELPPPVQEDAADAARALQGREMVAGYADVLRQLAGGDQPAALRGLYELESRVLESSTLEDLEKVQNGTLATLLKSAWPGLLPVILLHADAVRGYRAASRSGLAGHAERMVQRLTLTYAERVPGADARRDAVWILTQLAAEQRRQGTLSRAEALYRRALKIDPENGDVVLALAAVHERLGRYGEAVDVLESMSWNRLAPEARLRLAMNLQRQRQRDEAERLLRRLSDRGRVDWIRVIACEELAKLELERGDAEAAVRTLRRGLERWPGHPALEVQLAYVLDRLERPAEATELLEKIGGRALPHTPSERYRYNEWPRTELDDGRRELDERAAAGLDDLARALDGG